VLLVRRRYLRLLYHYLPGLRNIRPFSSSINFRGPTPITGCGDDHGVILQTLQLTGFQRGLPVLAQRDDYYGTRYPELGGNSAVLIFIPSRSPADTRRVEQSDTVVL